MATSLTRRLLIPAAGGAVTAFLVVGVLVADLSMRQEGAEPASIILGWIWVGPWALLVALPLFVGGGLVAGAVSPFLGGLSGRLGLGLVFAVLVGGVTALAVSVFVPFLWWPSGIAAMVVVVIIAAITSVATFPRSGR